MTVPTPGPWFVRGMNVESKIAPVCLLHHASADANGHLIAAAPELRHALVLTLQICRMKWGNLNSDANVIMELAEDALAKANGEGQGNE